MEIEEDNETELDAGEPLELEDNRLIKIKDPLEFMAEHDN
jgi:hypothetical protein